MNVLKPERMRKLIIAAPKSFQEKAIGELYKLETVHIVDHTKGELEIGEPLGSSSKLSEALISVRSIMSNIGLTGKVKLSNGYRAIGVRNFAELSKKVRELHADVASKLDKIKQLEDEIKSIDSKRAIIAKLTLLKIPIELYFGYSTIDTFTGHVKNAMQLATDIARKTGEYELYHEKDGSEHIIALFVPKYLHEQASEALSANGFSEMQLAPVHDMSGSPADALKSLDSAKEKLEHSKEATKKQLSDIAKKWNDFLLLSEQFLSIELEKAEAPLKFASSQNVFLVSGWIPEKNSEKVREAVTKLTKGNCEVSITEPGHHDEVPVKLENSRLSKPFEFLMNLYSLPKYGEIDPTLFMFITFPLFFGIILGDVGYGATIALLALFIQKKIPSAATLTRIIMPAAISSIFFGLLFGEVFGFEEIMGYPIPHVISRLHQITEMLYLSVLVGLVHINLGLLLGFVNELEHGLKKAILAKGSWWVLQLGIAGLAGSATGVIGIPIYISGAVIAISIVMIYLGESMAGIIEIPALISNTLSYSRLMAVGLASVGLAVVVNGFIEQFMSAGGLMIIPAIIIGILGHGLNIALGILGGFLHSIRLHYVEFFTKFFKGGAIPFKAFGKTPEEAQS